MLLLLLLLSRFSHVWLCATPQTVAHQAPPSLGFSRQEHWSGLQFPSMHESEKWKWSHSVMSDSSQPHGLQPTRLLCPWDFPGKRSGVRWHYLLQEDVTFLLFVCLPYTLIFEVLCLGNSSGPLEALLLTKLVEVMEFQLNYFKS